MIVVATDDFRLYHAVLQELRDRGVAFTTIEPDEPLPEAATVVITAPDDRPEVGDRPVGEHSDGEGADSPSDVDEPPSDVDEPPSDLEIVTADPDRPRAAVDQALAVLRGGGGRTIVGIDPGPSPGIAVLVGGTVVAAFQVPLSATVETVVSEVDGEPNPLVRVGDGDRLKGARIVNDLPEDLAVELVDETGTSPYLGSGARGMGDVLAAVNIARIEGEPTSSRHVEPTEGELQRIKNESRRRSAGDRTIDESLARRVAVGQLTLEEAIEEHRDETDGS